MKLVLVLLSLMVTMSCCEPEGVEPKFKKGEIVMVEGEKYVVDYSMYHSDGKTFIYRIDNLKTNISLTINENSITKYIIEEEIQLTDSLSTTESDTIAY